MEHRKPTERKGTETSERPGSKEGKKENSQSLAKKLKNLPLAEGVLKGIAVAATAATVSGACMTSFDIPKDVAADEDVGDTNDTLNDVPAEDVPPVDGVDVDDVIGDTSEEDVEVVCEPYDDSRMIGLGVDASMTVGGVDVVYRGLDTSDNPVYDLYCGDVPIRTNISVAVDDSEVVDVPEQGFRATLSPFSGSDRNSTVNVTVDAY